MDRPLQSGGMSPSDTIFPVIDQWKPETPQDHRVTLCVRLNPIIRGTLDHRDRDICLRVVQIWRYGDTIFDSLRRYDPVETRGKIR
jgi:hypothetical protein